MSTPHRDPAPLEALVSYVWALLGHRHRAMQADGVAPRPDDPWPGMLVSPLVAEARLGERPAAPDDATAAALLEGAAAQLDAARDAFERAERGSPDAPIFALRRLFRLDDPAWLAVLVALAAELDADICPTLAWLQGAYDRRLPSPGLIADIIGDPQTRLRIRRHFEPDSPLLLARLVELDPARPLDPLLHRPYRLQPRVVRFALGDTRLPPELTPFLRLVDPRATTSPLVITAKEQPAWDRFRAFASRPARSFASAPVLILRGQQGAGRKRWLLELARGAELPVLICDLPALLHRHPDPATAIALTLREARLQRAACALTGWAELFDPANLAPPSGPELSPEILRERRHTALVAAFGDAFAAHEGLLALIVEPTLETLPEFARGLEIFDVPAPSLPTRRQLWAQAITRPMRMAGVDPDKVAARFSLTPGRILEAVDTATEATRRAARPAVTVEDLGAAIREQVQTRMGGIATLRRSTETWEDLVTAPEVEIQLRELCHRYRHRDRVMDEWGLRRRFASAFGLSALFEGAPGTGKTMSAGLVARELGLDLYQVDLSQMVSKWVGETEKNLSKVFDEAERSGAMLLFDEADSIFSKRTSVSSANDRYANLEVNYLLQRIERFTGVAVLTTNFADSIDSAFARRLSMRITFPSPGPEERARLWASMLDQPGLPLSTFDCRELAEDYDFAGGLIRNAVLRAAFFAASRNITIDQELLRLSARIEMKEKGLLIRGNPHVELIELLTDRGH